MHPYCPSGVLNAISAAYYRVPAQRRPYCWTERQISRLFDDIVRVGLQAGSEPEPQWGNSHFLGTILVANDRSDWIGTRKVVVDGQQRLTTAMLLMICLIRQVQERHDGVLLNAQGLKLATADSLYWMYVREDGLQDARRYRLELPGPDGRALKAIIDGSAPGEADDSHVYAAYETIRDTMSSLKSLDTMLYGLMRLELFAINLPSLDRADEIFKNVNARPDLRWFSE
jgi:hypothetical protein